MSIWTDEQMATLLRMIKEGKTPSQAAAVLGVSRSAAVSAAWRARVSFASQAKALPQHTEAQGRRKLREAAPVSEAPPPALTKLAEFDPLARRVLEWRRNNWRLGEGGCFPDQGEADA